MRGQYDSPVLSGHVAQGPGHRDGPAHGGQGVEEQDPGQVEGEVHERDLERGAHVVPA